MELPSSDSNQQWPAIGRDKRQEVTARLRIVMRWMPFHVSLIELCGE